MTRRKPVIGLVGGIGAGKSTVAAQFAQLGCRVIDADAIGHQLLEDPAVVSRLRDRWGAAVFRAGPGGKKPDRKAIAEIVFRDPAQLEFLQSVLHPRIRAEIERQIARAAGEPDVAAVVLDAAVLFEARWDDLCTDLVFVDAPEQARLARVAGRGWDPQTLRQREKMQIPLDIKAGRCYHNIVNSSSVSHLNELVRQAFQRITKPERF